MISLDWFIIGSPSMKKTIQQNEKQLSDLTRKTTVSNTTNCNAPMLRLVTAANGRNILKLWQSMNVDWLQR